MVQRLLLLMLLLHRMRPVMVMSMPRSLCCMVVAREDRGDDPLCDGVGPAATLDLERRGGERHERARVHNVDRGSGDGRQAHRAGGRRDGHVGLQRGAGVGAEHQ